MATLADSLLSSSARKLSVRKRPDLTARRQRYLGQSYWVVKEPVGLNYFRFQDEEYAILQWIDGTISLDEIKERFEEEFPPQKITLEELQQFLGMLHRSGLIVASVPGQGHQLRKRRDERRRKEILGAATNILCIRFKGFDPERLLNWLYPKVRWIFSRAVMVFSVLLMVSALALILVEFEVFRSKLPSFYQFFSPYNILWLAITLGASKIFHEFGHGLTCKHYGGECHEMGVMILVLTPCLYCNVSDSWMLPNKWHRAAIGAAGIYVEMVLAAICAYVWWFTEPGLLNHICLNIMFIASVSTVLFNGNPLLRYDGYYILADILEIPNLRQKATTIMSRRMGNWFLGLEMPDDPFLPQRNQIFFMLYTVAAVVYRWFILCSIFYFLYKVFEPYGLQILGRMIVAMSIYGLVGMPLIKLGKFFYVPGRLDKVKKPQMYATLGGLAALVLMILFVPLPYSVMTTLEIKPRDAASVYVDVPGRLEQVFAKAGDRVEPGDPLAQLSSLELELEIAQLTSQRDQSQIRLASLERRRHFRDTQAGGEIPEALEALQSAEKQLQNKHADRERLHLVAKQDGTVLPPPWVPRREDPDGQLPTWSGTPLESQNLGCHLQEGSLFCQVGNPRQMEANLIIDQSEIDFIHHGQTVEIKLDELPHDIFRGMIEEVSPDAMRYSPKSISTKTGELATETDESGMERPMSTSYQATVYLDDPDGLLRLGLRGRGKVHAEWQTLARRLWRLISTTFNFKL